MTFLEAIKKSQPGQIIKNKDLVYSFVVLTNNKIKNLDSNIKGLIDDGDMNNECWEIE